MALGDIPQTLHDKFEIYEWRHASAILVNDYPDEWDDIVDVLSGFSLPKSSIEVGGGSKSKVAGWIDSRFEAKGWEERKFDTVIKVDDVEFESPTHKVDCFKGKVGVEIEWNNKDPFFDRDLNNYRLLFDLRALAVGVIITRCDELQDIFNDLGRKGSYGNSTTHMSKLLPRLEGGAGGGCPILVFGIRSINYDPNA